MKPFSTALGIVLLVVAFGLCSPDAWGQDWKEFAYATTGTFYYDTRSVSSPAEGMLRVWIHNLSKLETSLLEVNCKDRSYQVLDYIQYDEAWRIKDRYTFYDDPKKVTIPPGSVTESLHKVVCR